MRDYYSRAIFRVTRQLHSRYNEHARSTRGLTIAILNELTAYIDANDGHAGGVHYLSLTQADIQTVSSPWLPT